jgi:UDP-N-acetylglucosamine 2-epimerase (non-hydrolysing)
VEAGLRSGNTLSPFPEEMNRRLISRLTALNFAATDDNVKNLREEGIPADAILLTGNPVVDALHWILEHRKPSAYIKELIQKFANRRLIVLTTHRRENFGNVMESNLRAIRDFVNSRDDYALLFPVHPNPSVRKAALNIMGESEQVNLIDPLDYADFVHLLSAAWLIVSDSGGIQEEAPSLAKPLIVLRENTERPEVIKAGVAKLAGIDSENLTAMLVEAEQEGSWIEAIDTASDLFGRGDAGSRIADGIIQYFE